MKNILTMTFAALLFALPCWAADYAGSATGAELDYMSGVTGNVQTQLDGKAASANGVTNGDSHDHSGGDGAQIDHTGLSNIGTNTHAQIDTHITNHGSDIANVVEDTTPQSGGDHDLNGNVLFDATGIDDDDCTGDQGKFWWDSTDNRWEGCNANSGTPLVFGVGSGIANVVEDTTPQLGGDLDLNSNVLSDATGVDDDDCTGDQGKFWWDSTDTQWEGCNDNSGTPVVLGDTGSGDISGVLGDTTGDVPVLFQTWSAFTASDATPDVSAATFWRSVDTTTITDFDGTPVDGQALYVYCGAATVFDLTSSGLEAWNRTTDHTCTVGQIIAWKYRDTQWYAQNIPDAIVEISSNGLIARTGAGTAAARTFQDSTNGGLDVTNGDGVSGNPQYDPDLTPSSGNATLIEEEDAIQVKYDSTLTEGASGLGIADDGIDSEHYNDRSIDAEHINLYTESVVLAEPDQLQPISDAWLIKYFPTEFYPSGVTIVALHIATSATCTDALNFEEWGQSATSATSTVEAITLSGTFTEDDGTLADAAIAADGRLMVDLPATPSDIGFYEITVIYYAN